MMEVGPALAREGSASLLFDTLLGRAFALW